MKRKLVNSAVVAVAIAVIVFLAPLAPTADEGWVIGDIGRVATALGVQPAADGRYDISEILSVLVARPSDASPVLLERVPGEPVRAGQTSRLTFRTLLGDDFVQYRIAVVYLATNATAKAEGLQGAPSGRGERMIWWDWPCDTAVSDQDAVAVVMASWGESGVHYAQAFVFHVE